MQVTQLCHKLLLGTTHLKRLNTLSDVVSTSLNFKTLSATQIARKLKGSAKTKSNIRKVDRLLSNEKLLDDVEAIYSAMNRWILTSSRPYLNIDGSKLLNSKFYTLRATLQLKGRGITVYETVYTQKENGSPKLYKRFVNGLKRVIPKHCQPILVTDAEFRVPWFMMVLKKGWDFIGRIRGDRYIALDSHLCSYNHVSELYKVQMLEKPESLGYGELNKTNALEGYFYRYKSKPKGRHAYTRSGRHSETDKSKRYAKEHKEAWVLFSSLQMPARTIIRAYTNRMTIEENFRDTKSARFGLALDLTRSKKKKRYVVMLMIAMVTSAIAYIFGTIGEMKNLQYDFQANSIKHKRVLSRFFLGCEMVFREYKLRFSEFIEAIDFCIREVIYE